MARAISGRIVTGGIVVLMGLALLASTTEAVPVESVWDWLPGLFVLIGLWALVTSGFRNLVGPVMAIAIAGTFQARNLGYVTDAQIGTWWPLFVVLFGALIVLGRFRPGRDRGTGVVGDDAVAVGVFGGGDRRISSDSFTGMDLVSVFGGVDPDLRDAGVADPPAVVEVVAVFGGSELRVPDDWAVEMDALALFGAAEDERRDQPTGDPDLVVTGLVLFGGVSVTD